MTTTFKSDDQPFLVKKEKVHIRIVVIGHVNSGKSTTIHNLIDKLGGTDHRNIEGSENEASKANKRTFKYAWVLNKLNSEYERGVTLDLDLWKFETSKYHCTIIDAPGHIKNMIIGISHADVAVLIIDSTISGVKAGICKGGQTREQALLAFTLGVKQMICCCNKMDAITPIYSEARFDEIKKEVSSCLMEVGYDPNIIPFVPISGLEGDNITESSTRLSWYMGPTLYQAFDLLVEFKSPSSKLSRHLEDEHKIGGLGTVLATRVKTRIRKPGMVVTFGSSRLETRVNSDNPLFATEEKVPINILVIGHVNSGKSTTTGHLIHRLGRIGNRYLQRLENEATEGNKKSSKYAWVLDKIKAEYERDISIDISLWKFETLKYYYTVFDAPGHRHLIKNMIIGTGTSQVDCAVLIIDSTSGAFEAGISKEGQTRGYALLAHTLGVKEMICCCNKMDATTPNYSQARYNEIKRSISSYLMKVGYNPNRIPFIPISGLEGDNIIQYSRRLSWYKGPTLYLALDYINEPTRPIDELLGVPLEDVCKIGNIRNVSAGRVENSNLNSGKVASCGPYGLITIVEMHHESLLEAFPADSVAFNVKNVAVKDCGHEASKSEDDPVKRVAVDKKDPTVT